MQCAWKSKDLSLRGPVAKGGDGEQKKAYAIVVAEKHWEQMPSEYKCCLLHFHLKLFNLKTLSDRGNVNLRLRA